jgi:hypothetical protein
MQAHPVDTLGAPQLDEVCLGRELHGLQLGHPKEIPSAGLVLNGRDAHGLRPIGKCLLVQWQLQRQQSFVCGKRSAEDALAGPDAL